MLKAGEKASLPATLEACSGLRTSGKIQTLRSKGRTSGSVDRAFLFAASREGDWNCLALVGLVLPFDSLPVSLEAAEVLNPSDLLGPGGAGLLAAYTTVSQFKHLAQAMLVFSARLTVSREVSEGNWT